MEKFPNNSKIIFDNNSPLIVLDEQELSEYKFVLLMEKKEPFLDQVLIELKELFKNYDKINHFFRFNR